ncbi:MAG: hypothetical protein ACREOM_14630 [Candidatus Dormibacteraceae bacterium]
MDDIAGLERMELGFAGTALRQKLVNAVLSGAKTATASLRSDYEPATVDPMPVTGRR